MNEISQQKENETFPLILYFVSQKALQEYESSKKGESSYSDPGTKDANDLPRVTSWMTNLFVELFSNQKMFKHIFYDSSYESIAHFMMPCYIKLISER